ncbi:MAG: polyprenyl diphosphate synthase [Bacilli bacterium]|nr:polyprenyl diphosphate synthase [Bacilli bacterium]MDD4809355.1 polyprenyl diphosphate synthase [Bacilli bacterium]
MDYNNLKIPDHVGIIVDGNGRWAEARKLSRSIGHKAGAKNLEKLTRYAISKGIKVLSLYVFSTENFKRSKEEVDYLMNLFITTFKKSNKKYAKENIKVVFSGREDRLSSDVIKTMNEMMEMTKNNTGGIVNFCLNYGGHSELIDACKKISQDVNNKVLDIDDLNEEIFPKYLYNDLPPIDLLIRTGGEYRISNFMLWHLSYAEFYFTPTYFPGFGYDEFDQAILDYTKRDRRFGGINYENKNN